MNLIKKVPIPICGVALGAAALGNLLQSYSEGVRLFCGAIAAVLLLLMLLKLIFFPKMVKEDMNNPIMASVSGTCSMALMLLSVYAKPFIGAASYYIWLFAIGLHIALIVYFTIKFIVHLQMPKVFASYFIVYVGIAVAAITAPAYERTDIGTAAFWFGFVSLIVLLVLVTVRYVKYKEVPEPAQPLFCIYAAPTSLCLAGYIQSVMPKSYGLIMGMFIVSSVIYVIALVKAIGYLKLKFYPSFAAFTFPFVISAIAAKQTMVCLGNMGSGIPALSGVVLLETIIAAVFVAYVLGRFVRFLFSK